MNKIIAMFLCICVIALAGCSAGVSPTQSESNGASPSVQISKTPDQTRFSVQYIRTNGYHDNVSYPVVTVIRSIGELEAYYEANKELYDLESHTKVYSDTTVGFLDAMEKYDDSYFEDSVIILVLLEEGSGSIRHEVTTVANSGDSTIVEINRLIPETGTDDMAEWHLFIETSSDISDDVVIRLFDVQL